MQHNPLPPPKRFGPKGDKALTELSEAELLAEVRHRRERRGLTQNLTAPTPGAEVQVPPMGATRSHQVRQWLANLELPEDASLDQVEAAFERLLKRYQPALNSEDQQRRSAAQRLLSGLRAAYDGLRQQLL